jgi:anti-sigma factor RsiW
VTCDQCQDLLLSYAAGALDPAEREAVRAHVAGGCPRCAVELAEAEATVSQLPLALDPITPSAGAHAKLMERMNASAPSQPAPSSMRIAPETAAAPARRSWWSYAAAACIGGLIAAIAVQSVYRDIYKNRIARAEANVAQLTQALGDARVQFAQLQQMVNSPDLRLVGFQSTPVRPDAHGRILWDRNKNQWHISVFNMKPPAPGEAYELWFFDKNKKAHPGPMLHVDAAGNGHMTVAVPPDVGPITAAAFTNEKMPGVATAAGQVHLQTPIE